MTSLKELAKTDIINISCNDVTKLLSVDNKITKFLVRTTINCASLENKTEHITNLISVKNDSIHKLCNKIIVEYLPIIIKDNMDKKLEIKQTILIHRMIDYAIDNNMCDVINDIVQMVCDIYLSKTKLTYFIATLIIH